MNHIVPDTTIKPLGTDIMLMGIGVTHPSPGSKYGAPSISSVVASIDDHLSQWPGSIRTHGWKADGYGACRDCTRTIFHQKLFLIETGFLKDSTIESLRKNCLGSMTLLRKNKCRHRRQMAENGNYCRRQETSHAIVSYQRSRC